jgi:hypothetical protein
MQAIRDYEFRGDRKALLSMEFLTIMPQYYLPQQSEIDHDGTHFNFYPWKAKHFGKDHNYLEATHNYPQGYLPKYFVQCGYSDKEILVRLNI